MRVLVLQHPREQDVVLGSVPLLLAALPRSQRAVGLSWGSLAHALDDPTAVPKRWVVLYPGAGATPLGEAALGQTLRAGSGDVDGLVVLDGSWSQAKALWWRNPWLLRLVRVSLQPREPSIYGRLRREPQRHCVATLEAVTDALVELGESAAMRADLRRAFRTLVQRARAATGPVHLGATPTAPRRYCRQR